MLLSMGSFLILFIGRELKEPNAFPLWRIQRPQPNRKFSPRFSPPPRYDPCDIQWGTTMEADSETTGTLMRARVETEGDSPGTI